MLALGCGSSSNSSENADDERRSTSKRDAGNGRDVDAGATDDAGSHANDGGSRGNDGNNANDDDSSSDDDDSSSDDESDDSDASTSNTTTDGDASSSSGAQEDLKPPPPIGDLVFSDDQVLDVELNLDPTDWEALEEQGNEETYVPAQANIVGDGFGEASFAELGLRHKGAWSLHHCWDDNGGVRNYAAECAKLSYKLKFDKYDDDARLDGLKRLNLHASAGDFSKLRELVAYSTFRDFGVDAPRTALARVTINGQLQGVFIAVEAIDGRYTKSRFRGGDGNLYKEIWPKTGQDDEHFIEALRTNEDVADVSAIHAFAAAIEDASASNFRDDIEAWVDVDALLRYIAVDRALKNWDGVMTFYSPLTSHNFYWYHDDVRERFELIPWDLDNTFWPFDPVVAPQDWATNDPVPDWNVEPLNCEPRSMWEPDGEVKTTPPRCDTLLDRLAVTEWQRFAELSEELIAGPLSYDVLSAKAAHYSALLEPLVDEDPLLLREDWELALAELDWVFESTPAYLENFVETGLIIEGDHIAEPDPDDPILGDPDPDPVIVEPTEDALLAVGPQMGLVPGLLLNYEFDDLAHGDVPDALDFFGDELSESAAYWNTSDPITGSADLRHEFIFNSNPAGTYDEWVNLIIPTEGWQAFDVRAYDNLVMSLVADGPRMVRIRVMSGEYDDSWGGVWSEFGEYFDVSSTPTTVVVPLHGLTYPDWARDEWEDGQGWSGSDASALQQVLANFTGVLFGPHAHVDDEGNLQSDSESGFVQIDNLRFE